MDVHAHDDDLIVEIYDLLYCLGAKATHTGFFYLAHAVLRAYHDPSLLRSVTKLLYPEIADEYNTSWRCVERCIRYTIATAWKEHPNRFSKLSRRLILFRPTPAQLIGLLVVVMK